MAFSSYLKFHSADESGNQHRDPRYTGGQQSSSDTSLPAHTEKQKSMQTPKNAHRSQVIKVVVGLVVGLIILGVALVVILALITQQSFTAFRNGAGRSPFPLPGDKTRSHE